MYLASFGALITFFFISELSDLRNGKRNKTAGFSEVQKVCCVQGKYPEWLLELWELFDDNRGSENDSPEVFGEEQLYIVLQLSNAGKDLESFVFNNAVQAYSMFQQVIYFVVTLSNSLYRKTCSQTLELAFR